MAKIPEHRSLADIVADLEDPAPKSMLFHLALPI